MGLLAFVASFVWVVVAILFARWLLPRFAGRRVRFVPTQERGEPLGGAWQLGSILVGFFLTYLLAGISLGSVTLLEGARPPPEAISTHVTPTPGLPAARAGVRDGDRITHVDGQRVTKFHELAPRIRSRAGHSVTLTVIRGEETLQLEVPVSHQGTIGAQPKYGGPRPATASHFLERALVGPARILLATLTAAVGGISAMRGPVVIIEVGKAPPHQLLVFLKAAGFSLSLLGLPASLLFGFIVRARRAPREVPQPGPTTAAQ